MREERKAPRCDCGKLATRKVEYEGCQYCGECGDPAATYFYCDDCDGGYSADDFEAVTEEDWE